MLGIDYRKDFFALKQEKKKNVKFKNVINVWQNVILQKFHTV